MLYEAKEITARDALNALGMEAIERQYGELVVKLAEDRFTLVVLG